MRDTMPSFYLSDEAAELRLSALTRRLADEATALAARQSLCAAQDRLDRLPASLRRRVVTALTRGHLTTALAAGENQ